MEKLEQRYDAYVDTFRDAEGRLSDMMQLKRIHTGFVLKNARLIADGESFSDEERKASEAAALLHDTGRYEQLKRYNTFRDTDSVDHAVFSHDIVCDLGWLDGREDRDAILKAVLYHNRRDLPPEIADPMSTSTAFLHLTSIAAHTVRDADKLDIFRVLESLVKKPGWQEDRTAFWNLEILGAPNPEVVKAVEERRHVDYQNIKTLADFVLIQVGWMISELHFATSRRLCAERGHLAFRRDFLHRLTDDPAIDRICDLALNMLQ